MGRRTEHHYENLGRQVEDPDVTRMAKESMAVSEAEQRAKTGAPEGRGFADEEEDKAADAIPPLPQAKPIPGHSKAVTEERLHKATSEPSRAQEAMPTTGNYGDVDEHALPNGPESKKAWPLTLLSGAAGLPIAALRLAGHMVSKVACRLGVFRQRGEETWQGIRRKVGKPA